MDTGKAECCCRTGGRLALNARSTCLSAVTRLEFSLTNWCPFKTDLQSPLPNADEMMMPMALGGKE